MAWWRYNAGTRLFEISNDNGATFFAPEIDAAIITQGQFPDARLSDNVAFKNRNNDFVPQYFASGSFIRGPASALFFEDTAAPPGKKLFKLQNYNNGELVLDALSDDAGTIISRPIVFSRNGDVTIGAKIFERTRPVAMGEWVNVPFNAANFYAAVGTVTVNNVNANSYTLIGKTMIWSVMVSVTFSIATNVIYFRLPGGYVCSANIYGTAYIGNVTGNGQYEARAGENQIFSYINQGVINLPGSMYIGSIYIIPIQ